MTQRVLRIHDAIDRLARGGGKRPELVGVGAVVSNGNQLGPSPAKVQRGTSARQHRVTTCDWPERVLDKKATELVSPRTT